MSSSRHIWIWDEQGQQGCWVSDAIIDPGSVPCADCGQHGHVAIGCWKYRDKGRKHSMTDVTSTLDERSKRYGKFIDHATISQGLQFAMRHGWDRLADDQKEALIIIAHKIARILNGDPNYSDSWHDIAGYATLVDKRLKAEGK